MKWFYHVWQYIKAILQIDVRKENSELHNQARSLHKQLDDAIRLNEEYKRMLSLHQSLFWVDPVFYAKDSKGTLILDEPYCPVCYKKDSCDMPLEYQEPYTNGYGENYLSYFCKSCKNNFQIYPNKRTKTPVSHIYRPPSAGNPMGA